MRVQELFVTCETKTKDNVFVNCSASIQYQVILKESYKAFYKLANPESAMRAYVFDVIRASLPSMKLDHAFESKDEISVALKEHLSSVMESYGFLIIQALVVDIAPDSRVRDAMNEINASKRLKEAATQRAEGEKVLKVKKAEAESESMYLSGVGVAKQRRAIMDGLKDSIVHFSSDSGVKPKDVMDLLILNQYFDTLTEVGTAPNTKIVYTAGPNPTRDGMMQANASLGI